MKNLLIILIFLMIAVILILTRPDKERHKEAMMKAIEEYVDEEARDKLGDNALAKIGRGIAVKIAETVLNSKLRENNFFIFNTTSVHLNGKDNTLSVGLLGMVFTFNKDTIHDKLEEALQTKDDIKTERETAKQSAKELKKLQKEQRKRERELEKEQKRKEKELRKEQKRREKEARKEQKRKEKENSKS